MRIFKRPAKLYKINRIIKTNIAIIFIILQLSMFAAASGETIRVSTNRYSVFAPFGTVDQINYDADNSSFTFAAGALLIGANGTPLANTNVTYYIYSGSGALKKSGNITTKSNGIAIVTYNTFKEFTTSTDTDYGTWIVKAALASNTNINSTAYMNINITGRNGCNKDMCHNNPADNGGAGTSPKSPYSDNSGIASTTSMAYGAHITKGGTHGIASSDACQACHLGTRSVQPSMRHQACIRTSTA